MTRARPPRIRRAFTLTEILIVIGIIVLLIALAVPAFSLITGGKSIEGATNQLSAALGRARAQAIGLQKITGVLFFVEPRSQRTNIAIVTTADTSPSDTAQTVDVWLDLADDADFIPLPVGVNAQTIADSSLAAAPDRYLGYNVNCVSPAGSPNNVNLSAAPVPGARYGGVILFDGSGRLISVTYGFKCTNVANQESRIGGLLKPTNTNSDMIPGRGNNFPIRSQFGLVMFEKDLYASRGFPETDSIVDASNYATNEGPEEQWLDDNATPILINRYTGTLVKGE